MVLEPLFPKLSKKGILYRCYRDYKGSTLIMLDVGTSYVKNYTFAKPKLDLISGSQMIHPDITYMLNDEGFSVYMTTGRLPYTIQRSVEQCLREVYTFRDTHHVTEYK